MMVGTTPPRTSNGPGDSGRARGGDRHTGWAYLWRRCSRRGQQL